MDAIVSSVAMWPRFASFYQQMTVSYLYPRHAVKDAGIFKRRTTNNIIK
jgi:hypothetical protein